MWNILYKDTEWEWESVTVLLKICHSLLLLADIYTIIYHNLPRHKSKVFCKKTIYI